MAKEKKEKKMRPHEKRAMEYKEMPKEKAKMKMPMKKACGRSR